MNIVVDNVAPDGNGITHVRQLRPDGASTAETDGRIHAMTRDGESFTPWDGQTVFPLGRRPRGLVTFYVNGMAQAPEDYALDRAAPAVTWTSPDFVLGAGDWVYVLYGVLGAS